VTAGLEPSSFPRQLQSLAETIANGGRLDERDTLYRPAPARHPLVGQPGKRVTGGSDAASVS